MRKIDWFDLRQVTALATELGAGMTVIKRAGRTNYNIIHTEREGELLHGAAIIHRTGAAPAPAPTPRRVLVVRRALLMAS